MVTLFPRSSLAVEICSGYSYELVQVIAFSPVFFYSKLTHSTVCRDCANVVNSCKQLINSFLISAVNTSQNISICPRKFLRVVLQTPDFCFLNLKIYTSPSCLCFWSHVLVTWPEIGGTKQSTCCGQMVHCSMWFRLQLFLVCNTIYFIIMLVRLNIPSVLSVACLP